MEKSPKVDKILAIIKEEVARVLNESISFYVDGYDYQSRPQNILDVKFLVWHKVSNELLKKMNQFQVARYKEDGLYGEQVTPDGGDAFETTGVMNFYLSGIPEELWNFVIDSTIRVLQAYNIDFQKPYIEENRVIRFPMTIHVEDIAPEMNLANSNARKLMNDILGYQDFEYSGVYPASDILMRISTAEKKLAGSDMRDKYGMTKPDLRTNIYVGEIGKEDILRYLKALKELAEYAIKNGNGKISIG